MNDQYVKRAIHDRDNPYMMMMRDVAQDERLSYDARGMLSYILSKPKDWVVKVDDLRTEKAGRDKVRGILKEMSEFGYAVLPERIQSPDGKWGWTAYEIYENPEYNEKFQPKTEKPKSVQPNSVNTSSYKIESQESKEKKVQKTRSTSPEARTSLPKIESFTLPKQNHEDPAEKGKRVSHISKMIIKLGGAYLNRSQLNRLSNPVFITTEKKGKLNKATASKSYDAPDKLYADNVTFREFVAKRLNAAVKPDEKLTSYQITGRMVKLICEYGSKGGWLEYSEAHDNSEIDYIEGSEL